MEPEVLGLLQVLKNSFMHLKVSHSGHFLMFKLQNESAIHKSQAASDLLMSWHLSWVRSKCLSN